MMLSPIRLICPNLGCRSLLCVPGATRGKTVRCRQCGTLVSVKSASSNELAPQGDEGSPVAKISRD